MKKIEGGSLKNKVTLHYFHNENTKILIKKGKKNPPFSLKVDKILWSGYFFYELVRKSLNLRYYDNNIEIERMCFLKNNKKEYLKSLEFLKQEYQKEINQKLKDNKI